MSIITKKTISITLAFLLTFGIVAGVYNDANATEYNKGENANVTLSEKTGLKKAEAVYYDISEEEYDEVVARENATKNYKYTDSYWSKFSEPYYNYADGMTAEERQVYNKIYNVLYNYIEGGEDFSMGRHDYYVTPAISCGNINRDALDRIHYVVVYEHPELYYIDTLCTIGETTSGNKTIQFEVFEDFADGTDRAKGATTFRDRIEWYLRQVTGKTLYDKEKQIHDLICENAVYSYTDHSQSSYSAIVEGETVCAGYSEGFNMLCHAMGIPTMAVTSRSHEWSQVKLGDTWYAVDVTWDDDDDISYDYFNKSDMTIKSYDSYARNAHTVESVPWDYVGRPTCPKDYIEYTAVYRLYNPNSGEHFYTIDYNDVVFLVRAGWYYEGVAWNAPVEACSVTPVYRLYSPSGDHFYTTDYYGKEYLVGLGWTYEKVAFYSDDSGQTPIYRLYNPNALQGAHFFTESASDRDYLRQLGWNYEGIGMFGM